jgi:hypothetical protein
MEPRSKHRLCSAAHPCSTERHLLHLQTGRCRLLTTCRALDTSLWQSQPPLHRRSSRRSTTPWGPSGRCHSCRVPASKAQLRARATSGGCAPTFLLPLSSTQTDEGFKSIAALALNGISTRRTQFMQRFLPIMQLSSPRPRWLLRLLRRPWDPPCPPMGIPPWDPRCPPLMGRN